MSGTCSDFKSALLKPMETRLFIMILISRREILLAHLASQLFQPRFELPWEMLSLKNTCFEGVLPELGVKCIKHIHYLSYSLTI